MKFNKGDVVRLSERGKASFRRQQNKRMGIVFDYCHRGRNGKTMDETCVKILWGGRKSVESLHIDYIEKASAYIFNPTP